MLLHLKKNMSCCKKSSASCPTKVAYAQVVVDISGTKTDPVLSVGLNTDCLGVCGIKDAVFAKIFAEIVDGECLAFKIKLLYEDCYFAKGLPPLVFTSTCAPDEHTYDAEVRNICDISNGQCAYFRVGLQSGSATCYPQCPPSSGDLPAGQVAFNVYAIQGNECKH